MKTATKFLNAGLIMTMLLVLPSCSKESSEAADTIAMGENENISSSEIVSSTTVSQKGEIEVGGNALILDDFDSGPLLQQSSTAIDNETYNQNGATIQGGKRTVITRIKKNLDEQSLQTKISNGKLIASMGYGITGVVELQYGWGIPTKLNLNLSGYKYMNVEYEGKSNFGRVYVDLFSNGPNRAFWRGAGDPVDVYQGSIAPNGSNRPFVLKIPLVQFTKAQDNASVENEFTMDDVDNLKVYFITQGTPGLNFAVKKIWFE